MVAAVETMAYAGEVPWHGLGVKVEANLTPEEMARAAGVDWSVSLRPTIFRKKDGTYAEAPNQFVLVRDTDEVVLTSCQSRYKPHQNTEAFAFFKRFTEAGKATMETAGSLRGGRLVWGLARLGNDFTLPGGDKVEGFILLGLPHERGKASIARTTAVRVVCQNTFTASIRGATQLEKRWTHAREFSADEAADFFDGAREQMSEFEKNAKVLMGINLSWEDAVRILQPVYQPQDTVADLLKDEKNYAPTLKQILDSYASAPGATEGTAWGLFNGVTHYATHKANRNADQRLSSAWFGDEQERTSRFLSSLLELA